MKRLGLFGGTFNPIHHGHLRTALEVKEHYKLDRVMFIPTFIPPHKSNEDIVSPDVRLEMIKSAVEGSDFFSVSDLEIMRKEISYSIDTVKAVKSEYEGTEFFFILGSDAFYEIDTWKDYEEFVFLCNFIVMMRPGIGLDEICRRFSKSICKRFDCDRENKRCVSDKKTSINFFNVTELEISSTNIRKLIKEGKSIKYLVPESVEVHIKKHRLYK